MAPSEAEAREQALAAPGAGDYTRKLVLVITYISVSACLIRFNKFLMTRDRFPYSMFLTSCHMLMSLVLCSALYLVKPSAFTGVANCEGKKVLVLQWMIPIGFAFAIALFASNQAYIYCSVSFLQFMKEANVIICFLMSCAAGLQVMNRLQCAAVLWIIAGAALAVKTELHFVFIGFVFQLVSQFAECGRAVMGEIVLGGGGLKLDPLSYTMFVAPTCLMVLMFGNLVTWDPAIPQALTQWWMYILPNSMIAFVLNVLVALVIKEISAVGFVLAGICKDIAIVLFSCLAFGEVVSGHQVSSFILTLAGVGFWSLLKVAPDSMVVKAAADVLGMPAGDEEKDSKA